MIKVVSKKELNTISNYQKEIKNIIEETLTILDDAYGENRSLNDDGGFVCIIENDEEFKKLDETYLKNTIPEYIDEIEGTDYISVLFLISDDFSIVIVCQKEFEEIISSRH